MPVLYYGAENIELNTKNINDITRFEKKMIRSIYNISKRCKMSNLRLLSNSYTNDMVIEILVLKQDGDYITDIIKILNDLEIDENLSILHRCKVFKHIQDTEHRTAKKSNIILNELQKIFNENNSSSDKISELLRYDNELYN
ncbi:unnamed protein product [Brachionus calyciflorus]|uniref:Uncharacterized protein n=1 Tax=Brachionus calyciflorus TaxID=104777 RepID=A0A814MG03_9BILA|nr:unnamed protein product [Brachionus calyciflorus]